MMEETEMSTRTLTAICLACAIALTLPVVSEASAGPLKVISKKPSDTLNTVSKDWSFKLKVMSKLSEDHRQTPSQIPRHRPAR
jgi:hypothetical protein